jgi:hypothetical protein
MEEKMDVKNKIWKRIWDMDNRNVLGKFPWQFIFDLEEITPDQANSEMIVLNHDLLSKIPAEWKPEHDKLLNYLGHQKEIFLAVSHMYQEGREYTVSGSLKKLEIPLGFHKIIFYDYHRIFDHYITSIITDQKGEFKFSFDRSFLHHHRLRKKIISVPDFLLKIFAWQNHTFNLIDTIMIEDHQIEIERPSEEKMIIKLGEIVLL